MMGKRILILLGILVLLVGGATLAWGLGIWQAAPVPPTDLPVVTPGTGLITLERVDEAGWPAEVKAWVEANRERAGQVAITVGPFTYLVVAAGQRSTGGYRIDFASAERQGGKLSAKVAIIRPSGMAIDVITYPVGVVRLPSFKGEVTFNVTEVIRQK